jgi:hypothetical protein
MGLLGTLLISMIGDVNRRLIGGFGGPAEHFMPTRQSGMGLHYHHMLYSNGVIASRTSLKVAVDRQQPLVAVSSLLDAILGSQNGRCNREDPN